MPVVATSCTRITIKVTVDKGHFESNNLTAILLIGNDDPGNSITLSPAYVTSGEVEYFIEHSERTITEVVLFFRTSWTRTPDYGTVVLTGLTIEGNGFDPFYGQVTALRHEGEV
jgi:hypothetical protein